MTTADHDIREAVRQRYAAAAATASCCGAAPAQMQRDAAGTAVFGAALHDGDGQDQVAASLGCGVPTAVADLHPGERVLDLGSGAGGDAVISARRGGPTGHVIGLDMTTEMLDLARAGAARAGVDNVEFVHGYLEAIPLPDASIDVAISNCVLNLAADEHAVLAEVAQADTAAWTGCIAGASSETETSAALSAAGFDDIEIRATHRVHTHATAAIIRATLPA